MNRRLAFRASIATSVALVGLFLVPLPGTALAMHASETRPTQHQQHYGDASISRILVRKSERKLYLLDNRGQIVRDYPVMLGPNPVGHKRQQGDGRTPEGRYTIDARNEKSAYHLSLRISYPNDRDVKRAKAMGVPPGDNIFIHGKPNGKEWMWWKYTEGKDWTEGCIAVSNEAMQEIWSLVDEGTEIIIEP